jgi:dihydrofolate reductase
MAIIGIVAIARNGAIGRAGGLPWHYSADLKFFREQTTGHACLMGRKTWLSLKRPLPNRLNIVLSRSNPEPQTRPFVAGPGRAETEQRGSVVWLRDAASALALAPYLACDLYILGGAQIFAEFATHIERWVVTDIPLTIEDADTFMAPDFLRGFRREDTRTLEGDLTVSFYGRAEGAGAPAAAERR